MLKPLQHIVSLNIILIIIIIIIIMNIMKLLHGIHNHVLKHIHFQVLLIFWIFCLFSEVSYVLASVSLSQCL